MWLLVFKTNLLQQQITLFSIILPVLHIIAPFTYFYWAYRVKLISDIDITQRTQRFGLMSLMLILQLISLGFIYFYGNPGLLYLSFIMTCVFAVVFSITLFWKISLHMTINTMGILLINALYGWGYFWLFLCLPLVMWSRLYLKKHTPAQLIAGAGITALIMCAGLLYFNFI